MVKTFFPEEIWKRIFEFDPTYRRIIWKLVMEEVPKYNDFFYEWRCVGGDFPHTVRWHCLPHQRQKGCWVYEYADWID